MNQTTRNRLSFGALLAFSFLITSEVAFADKIEEIFAKRGFDTSAFEIPNCCTDFPYEKLENVKFEPIAKFELFPEGPSYRPQDDSWFFAGNNALTHIDRSGNLKVLLERPGAGGTHLLPDGSILVIGQIGLRRICPDGRVALL
ncbi:MAG: hypothetical protein AAGF67_09900, partial [Verrucomicrobiota bacterium]